MINITQVRRVVFRKPTTDGAFDVFTLEPDDLGQDTIATVNIAPRMRSRASTAGTTETPISGTLDAFAGSITFLFDNFKTLGQALQRWTASTYAGADASAGQITDADANYCANDYMSVVIQGVCDDGSETDVELTRCIPSVDDDLEFGTSETGTVTLNLHPMIYNSKLHANDGLPTMSYRFGDYDTTKKMRLNVSTGAYAEVVEGATSGD